MRCKDCSQVRRAIRINVAIRWRSGTMTSTVRRYVRSISRLICVLAYGLSLIVAHHVQPIVAKAYNDVCAVQGVTYGSGDSVQTLLLAFAILSTVILLSRSTTLIVVNLIVSSITLLGAVGLLFTARNTPYECFTTMGTYEDHTSGLEGFGFWVAVVCGALVMLLCVDLAVWIVKKAVRFWRTGSFRVLRADSIDRNLDS
jgi:hypothetical protein